jgi:GTP-binding protein EngB required for normal cell division
LSDENQETGLAAKYESIRRREYDLISDLLELLPRIDALDEERVSQVRDALFHADHPFLLVFVGPFSSGKSSLINALLGDDDLLAIGPTPTTDRISILRYGDDAHRMESGGEVDTVFYPSPLLQKVSFVDTPGLESIFQKHEETTRKFLHRSDVVLLVMLATQAMTSRNVDYLQQLKDYGKKVIILINQSDLLTDEEQETVRKYVVEQSQDRLNLKPDVWMVSAKLGNQARAGGQLDEALWKKSGLNKVEDYIDRQLSDADRLRQKLETPLQITQNVHKVALEAVRANQSTMDKYQGIAENVEQQLTAYKREQEKAVREINDEIRMKFDEASTRGGAAIQDIFQLSRAFGSVRRGLFDLIGLSRLFGGGKKESHTRLAFERHKVYEPITQLPDTVDKLGPRLEGKDLQDTDDLVKYANKEVSGLPQSLREKVIGDIHAPSTYDRTGLQEVRPALEAIETEARVDETVKLEQNLRNVQFGLAVLELLVIISLIAALLGGAVDFSNGTSVAVMLGIIALGVLAMLMMPLVGRILKNGHTSRMLKLQNRYIETLSRATDKQVEYGMGLRREVVAPLTRLVETQTEIQREQLNRLQKANQEMISIESELSKLGKRSLFGLRG